jgi:hypothetical protein
MMFIITSSVLYDIVCSRNSITAIKALYFVYFFYRFINSAN